MSQAKKGKGAETPEARDCFTSNPNYEFIVFLEMKLVKGLQMIPGESKDASEGGEKVFRYKSPPKAKSWHRCKQNVKSFSTGIEDKPYE